MKSKCYVFFNYSYFCFLLSYELSLLTFVFYLVKVLFLLDLSSIFWVLFFFFLFSLLTSWSSCSWNTVHSCIISYYILIKLSALLKDECTSRSCQVIFNHPWVSQITSLLSNIVANVFFLLCSFPLVRFSIPSPSLSSSQLTRALPIHLSLALLSAFPGGGVCFRLASPCKPKLWLNKRYPSAFGLASSLSLARLHTHTRCTRTTAKHVRLHDLTCTNISKGRRKTSYTFCP